MRSGERGERLCVQEEVRMRGPSVEGDPHTIKQTFTTGQHQLLDQHLLL